MLLEGKTAGFADGERHPAVLLLHPNPAGGGTMDSKILRAVADAMYLHGVGALRYNSRGVGRSGGEFRLVPELMGWVEGSRETEDVGAALHYLSALPWVDSTRLALVGFSFGSRMVLSYLRRHPTDQRVRAAVLIGFPVAAWDLSTSATGSAPSCSSPPTATPTRRPINSTLSWIALRRLRSRP